jgi:hypothetical protein
LRHWLRPEIIPALLRHKDKLHPCILRFLIESLRIGERKHQAVADTYRNIANQFDEKILAESHDPKAALET